MSENKFSPFTTEQLKVMAYDLIADIERRTFLLRDINDEVKRRDTVPPKVDEAKKPEEPAPAVTN